MQYREKVVAVCPTHGSSLKRADCQACNAAYMRAYYRNRRVREPSKEMWDRARKRARRIGVPFALSRDAITIPPRCPALGIPLRSGSTRSPFSPSLDRIRPDHGYVAGNVRVLSDHANRLKGARSEPELLSLVEASDGDRRAEYERLVEYARREALLVEVRAKAEQGGRTGEEWAKVAAFLDKAFITADWKT